jgi:hypothetical protein
LIDGSIDRSIESIKIIIHGSKIEMDHTTVSSASASHAHNTHRQSTGMYVRALSPTTTTTTLRRKKEEPEDPYAKAKAGGPNYHAMVCTLI